MEQLADVLGEAAQAHEERFGSAREPKMSPKVAEAIVEEEMDLPLSLFDEADKTMH